MKPIKTLVYAQAKQDPLIFSFFWGYGNDISFLNALAERDIDFWEVIGRSFGGLVILGGLWELIACRGCKKLDYSDIVENSQKAQKSF